MQSAFLRTKSIRDDDDVRITSARTTLPTTWIISAVTGISSAGAALVIFIITTFYLTKEEAHSLYSTRDEASLLKAEIAQHGAQWQKISEGMARIEEKLQALKEAAKGGGHE